MSQTGRPPPLYAVMEAARLAALQSYAIAGGPSEEPFDTLVRMAAHAVDVPVAMLSFIGRDQLSVKAAFGSGLRQMPRSAALCNHTVADPQRAMVVPETLADARFEAHPMVVMPPYVRFYAGVCLTDDDGYVLGTLCVMDTQPASIADEALAALHGLARQAVEAVALRRAERQPWQNGVNFDRRNETPRHAQPAASRPVSTGWLGVRTEHCRVPSGAGEGRLLASVAPNSPADRADLRAGDIILSIDGRTMRRKTDITAALANCTGGIVRLHMWRQATTFECVLRLAITPEAMRQRRQAW